MLRRTTVVFALAAAVAFIEVAAQSKAAKPAAVARPSWAELTPAQHEALAPLAVHWDSLDEARKRKWLDIASKYSQLTPEGKERVHRRMAEFARLTPQQKQMARDNFRRAYELPSDQRESLMREYESLPEDKKRELEAQAKSKNKSANKASSTQ